MNYSAANSLREAGFPEEVVVQAVGIRNLVDEYCRGRITRQALIEVISKSENKPWFEAAFLDPREEIPEDVTNDKWYYEFDYDVLPIWGSVQCPTLFLFAEKDRWVPVSESITNLQSVTKHLLDAIFVLIQGTDHMMSEAINKTAAQVSTRYLETMTGWLEER